MRWINVNLLKPKMIVAKNINIEGLRFGKGHILTEKDIENIKARQVNLIPVILKELKEDEKVIEIEKDMEVDIEVLDVGGFSVKLIKEIKDETETLLSHVRSGKIINSAEVLNGSMEYIKKLTKNNKTLVYPLIAAKSYDCYTYTHLMNVATLTAFLAFNMGLAINRVYNAYLGGLYHDIGKIYIPDSIIKKNGKLDENEFKIVQKHPLNGLEIVSEFKNIKDPDDDIKNIVAGHHERLGGKGYPERFFKNDIPLISKIAAVVDVYDALTTDRPYRKALHPYEAAKHIIQRAGIDFDPKVASAFTKFIGIYPIQSKVILNTKEIATVIAINKSAPLRPLISVNGRMVDLMEDPSIYITSIYVENSDN
jgi:putative nucleotidyltransferase with HDIG domain